jgi:hypothetical protein
MSNQIDIRELERAIGRVGQVFVTKDVSEQPELRRAHPRESAHTHWHAFVGRAISVHHVRLGVTSIGKSSRGERWSKVAGAQPVAFGPPASPPAGTADSGPTRIGPASELGPQYRGDPAFTARMRLHQSWWRSVVLGLPYGHGPSAASASLYGNMLAASAGAEGKNFLTPEIFEVAKRRLAEGRGALEPFRLLHNLLSSQPMCFNLFGPLVDRPERATRLLRGLVGHEIARVRRVGIEWAPEPAADYLGDRTAFDAVIEYERPDGALALLGIETKLTDSFSQRPYDGELYRRWMRLARSPFRPEAAAAVALSKHNQLWRNHLLALAARDRGDSPYAAVRSVVVHHPLDADGAHVAGSYREHLVAEDDTFVVWPLDRVVEAFSAAGQDDESAWLDAFRTRYLALERSEEVWRGLRRA